MRNIASIFILLFTSTFVNAGILLDTGAPNQVSKKCVAESCYGTGEWWAISKFEASESWDITGFEFFANDAGSVGLTNYESTSWKIFSSTFALNSIALFKGESVASANENTVNGVNVTSFLLNDIDITLAAGTYFLAQHHDFNDTSTVYTAMETGTNGTFYNTDLTNYSFSINEQVAQKIYGKITAVPEPALMALFGLGLLSLGFSGKKKKCKLI